MNTPQKTTDLHEKIREGVALAYQKMIEEKRKNKGKIVVMKNHRIVKQEVE